jgi:hypothetical protein
MCRVASACALQELDDARREAAEAADRAEAAQAAADVLQGRLQVRG